MTSVRPERVWNTWDYRYPASLTHLPSGLTVKVSAYSGSAGRYQSFDVDSDADIALGPRTPTASYASAVLGHAGSILEWETAKADWHSMVGRLTVRTGAELLFRFRLLLEIGVLPDASPRSEAGSTSQVRLEIEDVGEETFRRPRFVYATFRSQVFCLVTSPSPVSVGRHATYDAIGAAFEAAGWHAASSEARPDGWVSLSFDGDPLVPVYFAFAQATDRASAREAALRALSTAEERVTSGARDVAQGPEDTRAVRDVMAWNTVWDPMDTMPYTCLSRHWIRQLGGRGVWMSDVLYNALMSAHVGDWTMARANLDIVLNGAQPAGNIPCLISGVQEWVDRTQLPVAAYVVYRIFLLTGDRAMLEEAYPILRRQQDWYVEARDGNANGLLEYGSSPTGAAPYAHSRQGAINESGMDNLAVFDDAVFDEAANTLDFEEVGHNSLVALDAEMLARIAGELGHDEDAQALEARSRRLREQVGAELWDPDRGIFAGRHWDGRYARKVSPTSFFPLVAGAATAEQAERLVRDHLLDPEEFWGTRPLPSAPLDDPVVEEDMYWRGRCWPPLNLFVWEGLRRYGYHAEARELALRGWRMFQEGWASERRCRENFHVTDPARDASPDSDDFYSWGALLALISALDAAEVSPWAGLSVGPQGDGYVRTPGRTLRTGVSGDVLTLSCDDRPVLTVSPPVAMTGIRITDGLIALDLPDDALACRIVVSVEPARIADVKGARIVADDDGAVPDYTVLDAATGTRRVRVLLDTDGPIADEESR